MAYQISGKRFGDKEALTHNCEDNDLKKALEEWGDMHGMRDPQTGAWTLGEKEYRVTITKYGQPEQVRPLSSWLDFFTLR